MHIQSGADVRSVPGHHPRVCRGSMFALVLLLTLPAAQADMFLLNFSNGISGSGVLTTTDPCSHIPDPGVWWTTGPEVNVCPVGEWESLDIGIYSPETGFTSWSLGNLDWDAYEMYPVWPLPPYFYPDDLRLWSTMFVQGIDGPMGDVIWKRLEIGGTGSGGYATVSIGTQMWSGSLAITHVPEPASIGLIIPVVGLVGLYARRKRRLA